MSTAIALVVLVLVVRYLPRGARNAQADAAPTAVRSAPSDLRFSNVQISQAVGGEALYLDGLITNDGKARITGVTAEVDFHDARGQLVASVQKPLAGMSHGGTDLVRNEFARNPIQPSEMRFFRIAVEQVPPTWNHEVPELKVVEVKARR